MRRHLELAGLGLALSGWLCAILTRCTALWTVIGTVDNSTASLPVYWDGAWLEWNHWDLLQDGQLHCSFYQSLLSLSGSFRTWRALIMAAVGAGAFATLVGAAGVMWFPKRGQVKVFSGAAYILSGVLILIPTAWTCHHTSQPLEGATHLKRDWGPALYLGWVAFGLMMVGGAVLTTLCPTTEEVSTRAIEGPTPPYPEDEVMHPLSSINRATFTHNQYQHRSMPV
ncbi:claudin-4-like [Corythoichthys intestinalis]|uniref:claudin-4-like n=1 Tax=Corythoichthys intestinalis TaxID=161448 RepID=UPI0025A5F677|nr:claudin-4-like [Corythoichthys intestinalis]XP_057695387.1 claudin-4-like [Corythoichthys intestinalis]XP_061796971.1 claudin-4-like [Nerophis lumbriciformis]